MERIEEAGREALEQIRQSNQDRLIVLQQVLNAIANPDQLRQEHHRPGNDGMVEIDLNESEV